MKNLFKQILMIVTVLMTVSCFVSCGSDDDNETNESNISDGIDYALLPGHYEFNGNIAPSFTLYEDGTCEYNSKKANWSYNKTTNVLLMDVNVYTILMLTKDNLVAKWTSVKYGTNTSSWVRSELPNKNE